MRYSAEDCKRLLRDKAAALKAMGEDRCPRRSDFSEAEVAAVKSFFGPWPRALEAAGVKPPRDDGVEERRKQKRIRSKRRRTAAKKQKQEETKNEKQALSQSQSDDSGAGCGAADAHGLHLRNGGNTGD